MCAYDYSDGFVENMKTKAAELNVGNLEARQGDSHAQLDLYPGRRFDLIFGCNLIDRLHTPHTWVKQSKVSRGSTINKCRIRLINWGVLVRGFWTWSNPDISRYKYR